MSRALRFEVVRQDGTTRARTGRIQVGGRSLDTPVFAPVATRGSVKGILPGRILDCGVRLLLANAYHLAVSPGADVIADLGGLHRFMGWDGLILTDSGGYQVFSLSGLNRIREDGVEFRNPRDGSLMFMGPAESVAIQQRLGSDIAMAFDDCPPCPCGEERAGEAVDRTLRWAMECRKAHPGGGQALFGIVQGGVYKDLRRRCARELAAMDFDGYAIGGVSVGEEESLRDAAVRLTAPLLPADRPRYLMGVGFPPDILRAVGEGIDLFDCVAPTRMGRNATAFTASGRLRLRNSSCRTDSRPLEDVCNCPACALYSRGYIHHLFLSREMLGPVLLSIHNISFYQRMMTGAREAIEQGEFGSYSRDFLHSYGAC